MMQFFFARSTPHTRVRDEDGQTAFADGKRNLTLKIGNVIFVKSTQFLHHSTSSSTRYTSRAQTSSSTQTCRLHVCVDIVTSRLDIVNICGCRPGQHHHVSKRILIHCTFTNGAFIIAAVDFFTFCIVAISSYVVDVTTMSTCCLLLCEFIQVCARDWSTKQFKLA